MIMRDYTPEQIRAARRARKALKELSESGLYLIQHASSGDIYAIPQEMASDVSDLVTYELLDCGHIDDAGDW